ncbi:MAG: FtsW/RodA/SpoVE family cell cycle protein [Coriobacteriia bacterium]
MRQRRTSELLLMLAAAPAVMLAFALVHGAARSSVGWSDLSVPGGLFLAFCVAHLAARRWAPEADPVTLPVVFLLCGIGLAVVTRLDARLAASQTLWVAVGVGVLVATLALVPSLERVARYKYTVMLAGLTLLLLPAAVGKEVNGAKLWLRVGGLSFQPAEIAKVLLVLFLAAYLAENREVLSVSTRRIAGMWVPAGRHLGPMLAMWAVSLAVLVLEKDLGSSLLFFGIFLVMVYVATGRPAYVVTGILLFAVGAAGAYAAFGHVQTRIAIWLAPFADADGKGYQLVQSLFALAAGGMTGTGLGKGMPGRIPFVETDFVFSAIGEELGLLGAAGLLAAYLVVCLRGLATAVRARSDMAALTAAGLVATFGLQTFVIVGGVTRLIPLTGITLPFVSYGGSSVLANFVLVALLMRAGDAAVGPRPANVTGTMSGAALGRRLTFVAGGIAALLLALVANLTYLQVLAAPALAANAHNTRALARSLAQERGSIVTADGVVLAESVADGAFFRRRYPQGSLAAHVVGYFSPTYGRAGLESSLDPSLAGHRSLATPRDALDAAAGVPVAGADAHLTIDSRVQRAAQRALAGRRGACVVLDPRTGAVLALASSPTFAPGRVDRDWESISASGTGAPLVDRAIASLYPPGSTFKLVTLTGALASGVATPGSTFPAPARLDIGGAPVTNFEGGGYGLLDLHSATERSVNTVFAQLAVREGARALVAQARRFGFDRRVPLELRASTSLMPDPDEMTTWELAWAGVGQPVGEHASPPGPQTTALEMALVAAGIGNGGVVMRPYLVQSVTDRTGRVVSEAAPRAWTTATDERTAATVRDIMVDVVEHGSGTRARIRGVAVAGKTGTAEVGAGSSTHAWFVAFAPAGAPRVAMAIVLERAGVGGRVAAPAARGVLETALSR